MPITQSGHPGQDHSRDPCPWVILNDFGGAFAMGCIGGTIWHGIKGARNSPRGERFLGSVSAIKARAPVLGGNFGIWGGLFTSFDCSVKSIRQKEDPWNAIIAGFFTGSTLAIRGGPKTAAGAGVMCGILLGVFEGVYPTYAADHRCRCSYATSARRKQQAGTYFLWLTIRLPLSCMCSMCSLCSPEAPVAPAIAPATSSS